MIDAPLVTAIASLVVAVGGIATVHYRYRGDRDRAVEEARATTHATMTTLFQDERARRDEERREHIAELRRLHDEHHEEVARVRAEFDQAWSAREAELIAEHHREIEIWKRETASVVRTVARLVSQLDPMRTPTPHELERLRDALRQGGVSPSDINGLIAGRGVAGT